MTRNELIDALDSLCWSARRYGHDDYGLDDFAVDYDGNPADTMQSNGFHRCAVAVADALIAAGIQVD